MTGCNDAFIIDGVIKEQLIKEDPKSAEIIRPILRGRDVKRYGYDFADQWLIATHNGLPNKKIPRINVNHYPAVKAYLDRFYKKITKRFDKGDTPYNLRSCAYWEDFSKQKIVWGEISDKTKFAFDNKGEFVPEATTFLMTGDSLKYLLAFLNSKFSEYYFSKIGTTTGVGTVRWKKYKIEQLQIPKLSEDEQKPFVKIVDKITISNEKMVDTSTIEHELDAMIYHLFDFSKEEIMAIEK